MTPAIFLMGPTASGKTDLAVALCEHLPVDLISVDSALVYRDMAIGTARPEPEVLARAPHRLIDFLDPAEAYSAARFRHDALAEMQQISVAGRIPLLVGGTMLYFRALEQGLSPMPEADAAIRAQLEQEAEQTGWAAMHARLASIDAVSAARIHPNDPQRIQRALEVYELTGTPISEIHQRDQPSDFPWRPIKLVLAPADRAVLRERIAVRFHTMLEQGLVEEVEALRARGDLHPGLPSIRAVGYRQVWEFLDGKLSYEEMVEKGITATRQLAKRQMTWLRSVEDAIWLGRGTNDLATGGECNSAELLAQVLEILHDTPINGGKTMC